MLKMIDWLIDWLIDYALTTATISLWQLTDALCRRRASIDHFLQVMTDEDSVTDAVLHTSLTHIHR